MPAARRTLPISRVQRGSGKIRPQRRAFVPGKAYAPPVTGASNALKALARNSDTAQEISAILLGLLIRPSLADWHGEGLASLELDNSRQKRLRDAMLEIIAGAPHLETKALTHELSQQGLAADVAWLRSANRLRFSFIRESADADIAQRDFAMLVDTVLARARIDGELAAATARFQATLADVDFDRQRALLAERIEIDAAMMRLAESRRDD